MPSRRSSTKLPSDLPGQLWGDLKRRADSRPRRDQYRGEHRAIVAALRARNSTGAAEAMRTHLASVEANLLG